MYKEHGCFKLPELKEENTIWRYMDFWKFEDLIKTSELFMSTIKNMGDQFEGRIPDAICRKWVDYLNSKGHKSSAKTIELLANYGHVLNYNISSWNISKNESYALWKIYTKSKEAVSIKSNVQRLIDSLQRNQYWQHIGKVNYFDNTLNFKFDSNVMNLALNKFDYYRFEDELRIINIIPATEKEKNPKLKEIEDVRVKLDLDILIDSIYLAPNATDVDFENVKSLLETHNLDKDIFISGINDKWSY